MIRVTNKRVLEKVLNEEDITRYPLNWLYEKIIKSETTFAVLGSLLRGGGERAISTQSRER